jgi:predicted nucleotidyltransferase
MGSSDYLGVLRVLREGGVAFVLVGGLAAALNGAPIDTLDVDVVPARDDENLDRLLRVLSSMDAVYRIQPTRRLRPDASHLRSAGHQNLTTKYGPLDVLGTIGPGLTFEDLLPHSIEMDIGDGIHVQVLDLETIIAIKEELGTEKDLAVLPLLRRTLKEKQGR